MVIYPMREHDYDLVDDVNGQEIKSIFKNLKVVLLQALIDKYGKGKTCLFVGFLDILKAIDSVDRELLNDAMLNIGLPHSFDRLILSMYTCVSEIIQVGNSFSKLFDTKRGVKQGSTLSSKLFNIFISDVAFDSVDRELLNDAMLNIDLPHSFDRLILSMYTCVSGIIQVGNSFSKLFETKRGVKQGSTLSSKLFNIFISDVVSDVLSTE
ncbi:hypothetical protein QYM36_019800 [Artemia franciscana]|uniref:Reverse transcriptase domain-containing protein n=1 Tax=Artemia franciscana TaxID=6661 RepID=A0AA88H6Q3_ARTSF|nr:hypothetical protein QYM36_019800 [Artemia franciscana]